MSKTLLPELFSPEAFDDVFRGFFRPVRWEPTAQVPQIKIDVSEDPANYVVKAEIPGVRKEDIEVRVEGNQVSLSAEIKKEKEEKEGARVIRSERYQGYTSRVFALAGNVDSAKASARYENGILELTLPKVETKETKRVPVR